MFSELETKLYWMLIIMLIINFIIIKVLNKLYNTNKRKSYYFILINMKYSIFIILAGVLLLIVNYLYSSYMEIQLGLKEYYVTYLVNIILVFLFSITGVHGFLNRTDIKDTTFNQWNHVTLLAAVILWINLILFIFWYYK